MDTQTTTFWQSVLLFVLNMLQMLVNLVIWEKHQPIDEKPKTS